MIMNLYGGKLMLKTILLLFGSIFTLVAIIICLIALVIKRNAFKKRKKCSSQTSGIVVGHSMANRNGIHPPVVEYEVDGNKYKKTYSVGLVVRQYGPLTKGQASSINEDKISINMNQYFQSDIMRFQFPIGSSIPVYYNPERPEQAFVGIIPKSVVPKVFLIIGISFLAIGVIPLIISIFI